MTGRAWLTSCGGALAALGAATWFYSAWRSRETFSGLENGPAVTVLRQNFGTGFTAADGRFLYNLIVTKGYRSALDVGTAKGCAAVWMGLAMKRTGGRVVTIEINPVRAEEARATFLQADLTSVIEPRVNDALAEIPLLQGPFDLVFMDVGVPINKRLLELVEPKMTPGGALVAHNAFSFRITQKDFLEAIEEDRFDTKIVPTWSGGISVTLLKTGP